MTLSIPMKYVEEPKCQYSVRLNISKFADFLKICGEKNCALFGRNYKKLVCELKLALPHV